jgi:hypothetical protein
MKDLLKIGALLGGGFLIYLYMKAQSQTNTQAAPSSQPNTNGAPGGGFTSSSGSESTATAELTTVDRLKAEAARNGLPSRLNADQWGWVYARVGGQAAPDPLGYLGTRPRTFLFTAEDWYAEAIVPYGLSGLSRRAWGI